MMCRSQRRCGESPRSKGNGGSSRELGKFHTGIFRLRCSEVYFVPSRCTPCYSSTPLVYKPRYPVQFASAGEEIFSAKFDRKNATLLYRRIGSLILCQPIGELLILLNHHNICSTTISITLI